MYEIFGNTKLVKISQWNLSVFSISQSLEELFYWPNNPIPVNPNLNLI